MSVYRISHIFQMLGLHCPNHQNHWGADNGEVQLLTSWQDEARQEPDGRLSFRLARPEWAAKNKRGLKHRMDQLERARAGVPTFINLAFDRNNGADVNKRTIDNSRRPQYFLLNSVFMEGDETRGMAGKELADVHALQDAVFAISKKAEQETRHLEDLEIRAPVKRDQVQLATKQEWEREAKRRNVDPNRESKVYMISVGDPDLPDLPERFKIGYSQHPEERIKQLQTGSPFKLGLHTHSPYAMPGRAAYSWEQEIHRRLAEHRLHGEWFAPEAVDEAVELVTTALPLDLDDE